MADSKQKPTATGGTSTSRSANTTGAKTITGEDTTTAATPAATGDGVVAAGRFQPGETVSAPLTTNPPRGVDEAPSNLLADEPGARALQEAVKEIVTKETEQGYRGANTDPTPNENYTLQGVGAEKPTPETTVITPRSAS